MRAEELMNELPVLQVVRRSDRAMTSRDYAALCRECQPDDKAGNDGKGKAAMRRAFKAIVQDKRVVEQGRMAVIEGGNGAGDHGNRAALSLSAGKPC